MTGRMWVRPGYQSDLARNLAREGAGFDALDVGSSTATTVSLVVGAVPG